MQDASQKSDDVTNYCVKLERMSMVGSISGQQSEADIAIVAVLGLVHPETLLISCKITWRWHHLLAISLGKN